MATRTAKDSGVGIAPVGGVGVLVLSLLLILGAIALLYSTMVFWPPAADAAGTFPASTTAVFAGISITMGREQNLLLIVAILGGLGAMLHVIRSFFRYVGERGLVWSWVPSYFLIPFAGAVIAVVTYVILRAGLIGGTSSDEGNTWGFAAIAALVGLFSAQATSKLKDIFETILTPTKAGTEALPSATSAAAAFTDFTPTSGAAGTPVTITGTGLDSVTSVRFGGDVSSDATWSTADQVLQTTVPVGAQTGKLKVTVGGVDVESSGEFTVT